MVNQEGDKYILSLMYVCEFYEQTHRKNVQGQMVQKWSPYWYFLVFYKRKGSLSQDKLKARSLCF